MIFEIKPYGSETVFLTAKSIEEIPVEDLEDMYNVGFSFYWDGKKMLPSEVKLKIKALKEDAEWARITAEAEVEETKKTEENHVLTAAEVADMIEDEEASMTAHKEDENEQVDDTNIKNEERVSELDEGGLPEVDESLYTEDSVPLEDVTDDPITSDNVSEDVGEIKQKPGIYVSKDGSEEVMFESMAAASRAYSIPAYKISDAIKSNKEIDGYHFRKVE